MSDDLTDDEETDLAALSKSRLARRGLAAQADADEVESMIVGFVRARDWDSVIAVATAMRKARQ